MNAPHQCRTHALSRPWAAPLTVFAVYLVVAASAVFFTGQRQDRVLPQGLTPALVVTGAPTGGSDNDPVGFLESLVRDHHVNLYLSRPDLEQPDTVDLYAFIGDPASYRVLFPGGTYPSFSRASPVELYDAGDLHGVAPTGYFFAESGAGAVGFAVGALRQAGWGVEAVIQGPPPRYFRIVTVDLSLTAALTVGLATLALAGLAFGSARASTGAVREALGGGPVLVRLAEHWRAGVASAALYGFMGVLGGLSLWWYNDFHQGWAAIRDWSVLAGLGAVALQAGLLLFGLVSGRSSTAQRLRGVRPARLVSGAAVTCLTAAWVASLPVMSSGVTTASQVVADRRLDQAWWGARDLVRCTVSGATAQSDWADIDHGVGQIVRQLSPQDGVILSQPVQVVSSLSEAQDPYGNVSLIDQRNRNPAFPLGTWLDVNPAWLRRNPVLDLAGQPVEPPIPTRDRAVLLIPPSRAGQVEAYAAAVRAMGQADRAFEFPDEDPDTPFDVVTVPIRQQDIFTANAGIPVLNDSVIVVYPDDLRFDASLSSIMSQESLFFRDDLAFRTALEQSGLKAHLSSVTSVATAGIAAAAERRSQFTVVVAALVSLAIGLAVAALVLARSHCQAHRQRLFSQQIHGVGYWQRHGFMLVSTALGALVVGLFAWKSGWIHTGAPALAGLGLGAITVACVASALAAFDRRECALYLREA